MKRPALVRRREVWIPTVWGWFFILIVGAGAIVLAGRHAYSFLAPNQPSGARLLIVEGWMSPGELDQAIDRFRDGGYRRIVTTGSPIEAGLERFDRASYAELARDYLVLRGLPSLSVTAVPAPASAQDRTFLSAVMVREWLERSGLAVDALDVFSSGVHSRRSRALYRVAFGSRVRVGILAARPTTYDPDAWWRTSAGTKAVISEALGWIWTEVFFRPGVPGSHEEKWGNSQAALRSKGRVPPVSAHDASTMLRETESVAHRQAGRQSVPRRAEEGPLWGSDPADAILWPNDGDRGLPPFSGRGGLIFSCSILITHAEVWLVVADTTISWSGEYLANGT